MAALFYLPTGGAEVSFSLHPHQQFSIASPGIFSLLKKKKIIIIVLLMGMK